MKSRKEKSAPQQNGFLCFLLTCVFFQSLYLVRIQWIVEVNLWMCVYLTALSPKCKNRNIFFAAGNKKGCFIGQSSFSAMSASNGLCQKGWMICQIIVCSECEAIFPLKNMCAQQTTLCACNVYFKCCKDKNVFKKLMKLPKWIVLKMKNYIKLWN